MIVYKSRRFAMRRSGSIGTIGSLLGRYATNALLTTAAKTAMRGTLDAVKRAVPHLIFFIYFFLFIYLLIFFPHLIAHKVAAAKKRKRVYIDAKHSQEPQLKKAFVDTGGININALISE